VYVPEFDPERSGGVAVGVDIIEIARIKRALDDFGERFLRRVYTERERERYRQRIDELAARFAAKEATSKALGTGIRGIHWREMEILPNMRGKPVLILHGAAAARAEALGLEEFSVSLTHSRSDAMAFVVATKSRSAATEDDQ
jgi:holo-[acyl-carrier protein] synthase